MLKRKPAFVVSACLLMVFGIGEAIAQQTDPVPVPGPYPGGHVGLNGGAAFQPGWMYAAFLRAQANHDVIGDDGQTIDSDHDTFYAQINYIGYTFKKKLLGGRFSAIGLVTFNETVLRPYDDQSRNPEGWGPGASGVLVMWAREWKAFDLQAGIAQFFNTGEFDPNGTTASHGYGFPTTMPTFGGVWYPKGDRLDWNVSAVLRYQLCGTQDDTDIDVGNAYVIDWGVGKVLEIGKDKKKPKYLMNVGVSGFVEQQTTEQSGPSPSDSLPKYHVYGLGGEAHWILPKSKLSFLLRIQQEFGAKYATESTNVWMNVVVPF
jgi:hypothetical protein